MVTTWEIASYMVPGPVSSAAEVLTIIDSAPPDAALLDVWFATGNTAPVAAALLPLVYRS